MRTKTQGTVKWFDPRKGFGFIEADDNEEDVFVHYLEIQVEGFKILNEGQRVDFHLLKRDRGYAAEDVTPIGDQADMPAAAPEQNEPADLAAEALAAEA